MLERFIDFMLRRDQKDILDPIQQLKPFGRCRVKQVVNVNLTKRVAVVLDWPYLENQEASMIVYAREGRYQEGGWVQVIEARRGYDKNDERFFVQYRGPFGNERSVACHQYLARPMETEKDILMEKQISSLRGDLDPIIIGKYLR